MSNSIKFNLLINDLISLDFDNNKIMILINLEENKEIINAVIGIENNNLENVKNIVRKEIRNRLENEQYIFSLS